MKTVGFGILAVIALSACTPQVPASNAGPGFTNAEDWELERARREMALNGSGSTTFPAPTPVQTGGIGSAELASAGIGAGATVGAPLSAIDQPAAQSNGRRQGLDATPSNPSPSGNTGISDEQSFDAVAGRETIESDAQRRAAQAAARQQVQPTALPTRPAATGPNIVEYAINAPNRKGQEFYSRSIFATQGRFARNCATYNSPDAAQRDFLARGGPQRDTRGLDPDGDGFACGWDPAPFLLAARG